MSAENPRLAKVALVLGIAKAGILVVFSWLSWREFSAGNSTHGWIFASIAVGGLFGTLRWLGAAYATDVAKEGEPDAGS